MSYCLCHLISCLNLIRYFYCTIFILTHLFNHSVILCVFDLSLIVVSLTTFLLNYYQFTVNKAVFRLCVLFSLPLALVFYLCPSVHHKQVHICINYSYVNQAPCYKIQ